MATISLHKHVNFGQVILIVSDCHHVSWEISKAIPMQWNLGDTWKATIQDCCLPLTYRYVIVDHSTHNIVEWEGGDNRTIDHPGIIEDNWGMLKVVVKAYANDDLCLNLNLLSYNERRIIPSQKEFINDKYHYRTEFNIQRKLLNNFAYKYSTENKWERGAFRYLYPKAKQFMNNNVLYFEEESELNLNLNFDQIRPNLFVGPYLYLDDIELLNKQGISAILNLQTIEDLVKKDLPDTYFEELRMKAQSQGIIYKQLPIQDANQIQYYQKGLLAYRILRDLIQEGNVVYVHCTLGVQRSVQTIILYLILSEKYSLEESLEEIRRIRPQSNPYTSVIKKIIDHQLKVKD